jgi:hypothetical protein
VAVGITFLSPQIGRMGGHFSLSYVFAIPAILYFTAKFHERASYAKSIVMGLFLLWAVGSHVYMLGFFAFVVILYWASVIFIFKHIGLKQGIIHFSIQLLIPLALFLFMVSLTDNVTDRTSYPWGFLHLSSTLQGLFLPLGRPYAKFIYYFSEFRHVEWESIAFVGIVAVIGCILLLGLNIKKFIGRNFIQALWPKSNPPILNVFIWVSLISLFYSFGLPFRLGLHPLIDYIGPLKQMRGIARFSWIFFYVINIYVFYLLWQLRQSKLNVYMWRFAILLSISLLFYDAWYNTRFWSSLLNNKVPAVADTQNQLPCNSWVNVVDANKYQALLPIPYFHIGSENIWVDAQQNITATAYTIGWKTGLPSMGVMMGRTSISQTLSNLQLVWEPYRMPDVLRKLNHQKDILILAKENGTHIPESQMALIRKSSLIYQSTDFNLYSLPFDSLASTFSGLYNKELAKFKQLELYQHGDYYSTSKEKDFFVDVFSSENGGPNYIEGNSKSQRFRPKRMFYQASVPSVESDAEYILSFWVHGVHTDLLLRSQLIVEVADSLGANYFYEVQSLGNCIKLVDGEWALMEVTFRVRQSGDKMGFWLYNWDLRKKNYTVDQLLVRPSKTIVFRLAEDWIMRNNRFYFKKMEDENWTSKSK